VAEMDARRPAHRVPAPGQRGARARLAAGRRRHGRRAARPRRPLSLVMVARRTAPGHASGRRYLDRHGAGSTPTLERLSETPEIEQWPEFSHDGQWLAYGSDATSRNEIYIQPWPGPGPREQVSLEGGESPAWNPSGRELFFLSLPDAAGRRRMWAVDVGTSPRLRIGVPRRLFDFSLTDLGIGCFPCRCYAVSHDGGRFFTTQIQAESSHSARHAHPARPGWLEEMKARVAGEVGR